MPWPHKCSEFASAFVVCTGSIAVMWSYYRVFGTESSSYATSRFWIGIPANTANAIMPLQIIAGIGFIVFTIRALGLSGSSPTVGILSYYNGFATTMIYAAFFIASTVWPFATRYYLDNKGTTMQLLGVVCPLIIAAVSSILLTAGAFEADMDYSAVIGVLVFSNVVVLADGIGWNAKLIWSHVHQHREVVMGL